MSIYSKKRKDGSTAWFYDFTIRGKRFRGVGGTTKTQAQRVEQRLRSDILNGEFELIDKVKNPYIEKFAEKFLARRQNKRSYQRDVYSVQHLMNFFGGRSLTGVTPDLIEDYIQKRKNDKVSNSTINRELACFKRMYTLAIRWKDAKVNPVIQVELLEEPPGRTRYLSEDEASRLLEVCSGQLYNVVFVSLNTGLRIGELLALKWQNIYLENVVDPYIQVIESTSNNTTKSNKSRIIYLQDELIDLLAEMKSMSTHESVFVSKRTGRPLQDIRTPFKNALKMAGIENFKPHDMRHTFASHFIMKGGDPLTLKEILGHSSMKMVERYIHLAKNYKRKQMNNLKGVFTGKNIRQQGRIIEMGNG